MKKEVFFAVFIGSILGLVVAFGIWRANASFSPTQSINSTSPQASPTPTSSKKDANSNLSITKPEHNEVLLEETTAITGITKANSNVVVYLNEVYLVKSDSTGTFSIDIELTEGINRILVKSFDDKKEEHVQNLNVVYDPNIEQSSDNEANSSDTQTASDSVREKVQQKLEQVSTKPQAVIGTVTDKTSTGFNVRNGGSEIKQVTVQENQTLIIKSGQTDKSIPFSDLAIGDFVAAIGFKTSAGALEAMRVLIDNTKPLDNIEIFIASVSEVTKQNITLDPFSGIDEEEVTFRISTKVGFRQFSNNQITTIKSSIISASDVVIVTATRGTNALVIDDVYLIESSSPAPTPAR